MLVVQFVSDHSNHGSRLSRHVISNVSTSNTRGHGTMESGQPLAMQAHKRNRRLKNMDTSGLPKETLFVKSGQKVSRSYVSLLPPQSLSPSILRELKIAVQNKGDNSQF